MALNIGRIQESRSLVDTIAVAAAVLVSIALIHLVTGSGTVTLAYAGGLTVLGLVGFAAARRQSRSDDAPVGIAPDWAVTVTAIEQPGLAIAITDRANRLLCANATFELWFGSGHAPPRLPVDGTSSDALMRLARNAWRDGQGGEKVTIADEQQSWTASAQRSGRADDYLVWRFEPVVRQNPLVGMAGNITGMLGSVLAGAGICVALVGPDGAIKAANTGLARRAGGDEKAALTGQDFVGLLRIDERDRIFFAREGKKGTPQTLVHVPLVEPDADPRAA